MSRLIGPVLLGSLLALYPSMTQEGCGGDPTPTPTPDPQPGTDKARFDQYLKDLQTAPDSTTRDQLTSAFFREIEYSGGFPIHEGGTVTFVYYQTSDMGEPLRVAGDFNAWNATANPLVQAVSGYPVWYATLSIPNARSRQLYKMIGRQAGQDVYIADPVARRFQYDAYGQYSLLFGGDQTQPSHLERYPAFDSPGLEGSRDLWLYLPPGYEQEGDSYPVIYMHDGQNLFDPNAFYGGWKVDQVIDSLLAKGQLMEVIVAGIANTPDRMDEYTQVEDFLPAYGGLLGGAAPAYATMVVQNVKPFMDSRYRTRPEREYTAMLGSSLGGLVSFYTGYAYSDVFGKVGGMSSTFGWGSLNLTNPTMIHTLGAAPKLPIQWYLDSGGDDGGGCRDTDGDGVKDDTAESDDNFCETQQLYEVLLSKGYSSAELKYFTVLGQEHNEASWNSRLPVPLTFWFHP